MEASCPALRLRSGMVIDDPLDRALEFIDVDGTYRSYDLVTVDPFDLSDEDVKVANRIIARMGPPATAALLSRRNAVRAALADIPLDVTLATFADDVPWTALRRLYRAVDELPHIGLPRATKVFHKKRPALVPILDEVVISYLTDVDGPVSGSMAERGVALTRRYQAELQYGLPILRTVREELEARGFSLTECRLLDIYLWAYSGTYAPLWQRGAITGSTRPAGSSTRTGGSPVMELQLADLPDGVAWFSHDEEGFRVWRQQHPHGYVLNCEHQPSPRYLKLHRVSCAHLNRSDVTTWTEAYAKLCAPKRAQLDQVAQERWGATGDPCPTCRA